MGVKPEERGDGVRALRRGLEILRLVNASGGIRPGEIAKHLAIPRPTVYRLLQTLEEFGFVARSPSDERFRVTRAATALGDGYDPRVPICQSSGPVLASLSRAVIWPVDLSTYEDAAMVVQETTHGRSPMSIDRGMIGRRIPMLRTSAGRTYLAFSPPGHRKLILDHVRRLDDPEDRPFLEHGAITRLLNETRKRGYGVRNGREFNPKTASIAVPVIQDGQVLATLSVIWIVSALDVSEAARRFLKPVREAAEALARAAAARS